MGTPFGKSKSSHAGIGYESNGGPKVPKGVGFESNGGPKMPETKNLGNTNTDSTYKGKGSASPRNGSPQQSYFQTNSGDGNKGAM